MPVPTTIKEFIYPYSLPEMVSKDFNYPYFFDAVYADFKYPYSLLKELIKDFNYPYALTRDLIKDFNFPYDINETNVLEVDFKYIYALYEQTSEAINNTITASIAGEAVRFTGLSVSCDENSYCFSFSGAVATKSDWNLCVPESELTIIINSVKTIVLIIDERGRQRSGSTGYTVKGRSKTSRLDFPYADSITEEYTATTAKTIIQAMADIESITLDYDVSDWNIPKDTFSVDEQSPLSIIKTLAAAINAVVQTKENGDLWIRYLYPFSPTTFDSVTEDITITDVDDIFDLKETFELKKGYNTVLLSNKELSSEDEGLITIELDTKRNGDKTTFSPYDTVYIRVFHDRDYTGLISAGTTELIAIDEIFEAEPEYLDFVREEEPETARYIHNLISFTWYGNNLGAVTKSDANKVKAANSGENTIGTGYLRYNSKADIWKIQAPSSLPAIYKILALKGFNS